MAIRVRDYAPTVRAAGYVHPSSTVTSKTTGDFLRQDEPPKTPDTIKHFRKSYYARVGHGARHWGFRKDADIPDIVHGEPGHYESSVQECLRAASNYKGLNAVAAENAEKKYLRNRREPLGRGAEPPYPLPSFTSKPNFAFGIASDRNESAKTVIYNAGGDQEGRMRDPKEPGKQLDRNYDWAKVSIDPTRVRFGSTTRSDGIAMKELFTPMPTTKVLPHIVRQNDCVTAPALGLTRNLGFGSRRQDASHRYGFVPSYDVFGVRDLTSGMGVVAKNDETLGKSFTRSRLLRDLRAADPAVDPDRIFGCPSLRWDLPRPKHRRFDDNNNYGDEANASELLYPNRHGIDEEMFLKPMTRAKMEATLERSAYPAAERAPVLDRVFANAQEATLVQFLEQEKKD